MNEKIINTLIKICEIDEDYTMIYTPAHDRISLVYTDDFGNEILNIEKNDNAEYKFESESDDFTSIDIDFIISSIYNSLLSLQFESFIEDLNIDNINDFERISTVVYNMREKYC